MSLKVRLTLLLGVVLAVFLVLLQVLQRLEHRQAATLPGEIRFAGGPAAVTPNEPGLPVPRKDQTGEAPHQFPGPPAASDATVASAAVRRATWSIVVFGLLVIAAVWLAVHQWVQRPLDQIAARLAHGEFAPLEPLWRGKTEFAQVAQQIESSFTQKAALEREIIERRHAEAALFESEKLVRQSLEVRARLARDLHDGVIQSIYAAGLGLESALSQLEQDLPGARTRLQLCRQSLNDVIRQVRAFISGLEPEGVPGRGFAEEVATLARTMQSLWPVRIEVDVNPLVAGRLNVAQEVHALQIVRECISNALRHGKAKEVSVSLNQTGAIANLTVCDDGCGFDPGERTGQGSGLQNLTARAREMGGKFKLAAQPGRGVAVIVTFPVVDATP